MLKTITITALLLAATPAMAQQSAEEGARAAQRAMEQAQQNLQQQMQMQQLQMMQRPQTTCTQQCVNTVYGRQCTTTCN